MATRRNVPLVSILSATLCAVALVATTTVASGQSADTIWSSRAPLPESFSEMAVAELDGKIYVIGGYPSTRVYVDTVQVYDSLTESWSYAPPVPRKLHHTVAAGVNGILYVLGGEISTGPTAAAGIFFNNVYAYDPATGVWSERSPMPTARSGGASAVIDGKIYVAGGRPPGGADFAVYDPAVDTWTVLPNMPTQRNHLAVAAVDGKVYVIGGRFGGGVGSEMTSIVEAFDPQTWEWSRAAPLLSPRAGINGIAAQGCIYVFGGEGNDAHPLGIFPENEVYDPRTYSWHSLETIPTPVHGVTGAAFLDGWIHLPGGGVSRGGNSGSTIHQVFRPPLDCTVSASS